MNFKIIFSLGVSATLMYGCASTGSLGINSSELNRYDTITDLLNQKGFNQTREYVYDWGTSGTNKPIEVDEPKRYIQAYCQIKNGKFSLIKATSFSRVKDTWSKKLLNTYSAIKANTGHYKCVQKDGQVWAVTIEPTAERKQSTQGDVRVVSLVSALANANVSAKSEKNVSKMEQAKPVAKTAVKPLITKSEDKAEQAVEKKPETKLEAVVKKPVAQTPRQQQKTLYLNARRDINRGQNLAVACVNAEKAYNLGRVYDPTGPNIYVESGILVAKCLTTAPAYSKRFANPKSRARVILQEIVNTQNNAVAKHMLQQLK